MKYIKALSLIFIAASVSFAQNNNRRLDAGVTKTPEGLEIAKGKKRSTTDSTDLSESDTGAQRIISLKNGDISANFSYSTELTYQDNPFALDSSNANMFSSGVWSNRFASSFGLGIFDLGDSVLTPYVGGSWGSTEYTSALVSVTAEEEGFMDLQNYNSTNAFVALLSQYSNGWSVSGVISYNMVKLTTDETEALRDFVYSIKTLKAFSLDGDNNIVFDAGVNIHSSDSDASSNYTGRDEMNRYDLSSSVAYNTQIGPFDASPKYTLQYSDYSKGANADRTQFLHNLSLKFSYDITEYFDIEFQSGYTINDSSGSDDNDDYEMFDAGAGLKLSARF
jgi:hypothetical protein